MMYTITLLKNFPDTNININIELQYKYRTTEKTQYH